MARERHAVAQVATGGSCIDVRPTAVGMATASANQQQLLWLPSNGRCLQSRSSLPRPIGACRGRECGNQQPTHVISSSPHVVHAMHAPGAQQQPACSSDVGLSSPASASASIEPILRTSVLSTKRARRARVAGGDGLGATCSRSGSYRSQPYRRWSDSGRHGRCIRSSPAAMGCHRTGSQAHLPPLGVMANRRVPRP